MNGINPEKLVNNDLERMKSNVSKYVNFRMGEAKIGDRSLKLRELFGEETNKVLVVELLNDLMKAPWEADTALEIFISKLTDSLMTPSERASAVPSDEVAIGLGGGAINMANSSDEDRVMDITEQLRVIHNIVLLSSNDPAVDLSKLDQCDLATIVEYTENNAVLVGIPPNIALYIKTRREAEDIANAGS